MHTSNINAQHQVPLLSHLPAQTAHDKAVTLRHLTCSRAFQWSESTNDTGQEFRHRKTHISTSVILCKFTLALLVSCYVKGVITTDTNLNRSSSENTLLQDSQVRTISTFWINMLLKILQVGSPSFPKE